jgi:hypothetical protein
MVYGMEIWALGLIGSCKFLDRMGQSEVRERSQEMCSCTNAKVNRVLEKRKMRRDERQELLSRRTQNPDFRLTKT